MSPRSKQQFEAIREVSTNKILDAALELFGTVGYDATSIAQIAKRAGVSKGLIYNYFESKEDLVKGIIENLMKVSEDIVFGNLSADPKQNLENILRLSFAWLRDNQKLNRLIAGLVLQVEKFDFVHDMAVAKMNEYLALLESLLQQMNFPNHKTEARFLSILFDGIGVQFMVLRENYPLNEIEKMLIEKYCR